MIRWSIISINNKRENSSLSNLLANLLSTDQLKFNKVIDQLEKSSGNPSIDIRLMSEIIQLLRSKAQQTGLQPEDFTGKELYYALKERAKVHDSHLDQRLGIRNGSKVEQRAIAVKSVIDKSKLNRAVWVVKRSVLKRLLQINPPKRVMEILNYSSVDSMIKRENLAEIMGAARFVEGEAWLSKFNKQYNKLTPLDFETRKIEIFVMPSERWSILSQEVYRHQKYGFTHYKELGFVSILPSIDQNQNGYCLLTLPAILHYINEIRTYSAFFKLQQVRPGFGKLIVETLNDDKLYISELSGSKIHWRIIQRHYGRPENTVHPSIFQPQLQPEDLQWRRASETLYMIDPELSYWRGLDYIGSSIRASKPVSLNLLDVAMSYYFGLDFNNRIFSHMQASLWNELYIRYLGHEVFESQMLSQLGGLSLNFSEIF